MDPTVCWERLCEALVDGRKSDARDLARDLRQWVRRGGYVPHELASTYGGRDSVLEFLTRCVR